MGNEIYTSIKEKLKAKPKKLTDLDQWLFVVVNTAKSIIDNTSKNNLDNVVKLYDCNSTSISFPICRTIEVQQIRCFSLAAPLVALVCLPLDFSSACPAF